MASRIAKGFSLCTAIIGLLCLIAGIGIAVCAWVLNGQLPTGFRYRDSEQRSATVSIGNYWWGGMIYLVPGIIGIIAGCTRNVTAMIVYLIFNLICCICSLVVVVVCGLVLLEWVAVDAMLQSGHCHSAMTEKACICQDVQGADFKLYGGSCEVFMNVQVIVGAMVSMAAISSILSFIASYISCCALCNKESNTGGVIISGGAGVYQPPPIVVGHTTGYPPQYDTQGHAPPPYAQQQPAPYNPNYPPPAAPYNAYPMPYATSDSKANLVNNEYR